MVCRKSLMVALCLFSMGLYGAEHDDESLLLLPDQQSLLVGSPERSEYQEPQDQQQTENATFFSALGVVKSEVIAATLMLSNTFGRIGLATFLGYKGYRSATKMIQNGVKRSKYVLRTICYLGATCMLLSDGYQWVLRQGADA